MHRLRAPPVAAERRIVAGRLAVAGASSRRAHTLGDRMPGSRKHRRAVIGVNRAEDTTERSTHAGRYPAGAPRGGRALRPPDATVEPEDAAVPLRGAFRDLHHRPRAIAVRARGGPRLRPGA